VFNTFPIERTGGKRATSTARRLIGEGWSLLVFPEGTRSKDGWLGRWRHGAARLAIEYGIPVVPVALRGTYSAMPRGRNWPLKGRPPVSVRFGEPMWQQADEDFRSLSRRMQQALARLWDEDASTWYASLRRQEEGATPSITGPVAPRWRRVWESSRTLPGRGHSKVWR
jgi:1-acyl-sn-glycerol-3-phosphate acyltransferase